jgi:nucleotide-binding universal stress UspA family protein
MYRHLLIPSDGSKVADIAVTAGIEFARSIGARVTAFTAMPEYKLPAPSEVMSHKRVPSMKQHEDWAEGKAREVLKAIAERAAAAGVQCESDYALCDRPHEAIIDAATRNGCDLIFMASHGRSGLSALIHGSETKGVLSGSKIPTLVYR